MTVQLLVAGAPAGIRAQRSRIRNPLHILRDDFSCPVNFLDKLATYLLLYFVLFLMVTALFCHVHRGPASMLLNWWSRRALYSPLEGGNGVDLAVVKELLTHKDIGTTQAVCAFAA